MPPAETDADTSPVFHLPAPTETMEFTGERYVSGVHGEIQNEHYHRYFFALGFCANRDVLDVASGEGYGSALLGQVARSVIGVDVDMASVQFATRQYLSRQVSFRLGDAAALPVASSSIDVVVSFETIEHILEQDAFLREVKRVLRPDGILIVSTPDKDNYLGGAEENPFHLRELDKREFQHLLERHFQYVTLLEQRAFIGSVIVREKKDGQASLVEGFDTADCKSFKKSAGVPGAPFLIAIAGAKDIPGVPDSLFCNPRWIWRLEEEKLQAVRCVEERGVAEIAAVRADASRHREEGAAEIASLQAENLLLQREIGALRTACEKAELAAMLAGRRPMQHEFRHGSDEAEMLRNSTSWRITAPLRAIASVIKRLSGR